ncbi:MAG: hypothetical protein H7Y03_07940 [Chitinophagaceae bacterium]|nr:hypothetical protein [Chitinophagaceae bacterium]
MKQLHLVFISIFTTLCFSVANAQTADEIVNKHIEAIGGQEKLAGVKSSVLESSIQIMGNEFPAITSILYNKGFRSEMELNGQKIVQVCTDKSGWSINPMQGVTTATNMPENQYKATKDAIYLNGGLFNYKARKAKVELQGQEKIGAVNAYKIKLTSADSVSTTYYIDPASYNLIQSIKMSDMQGQQVQILTLYSDYRKTESGRSVPFTTETHFGEQFVLTSHLKKIEDNKLVDPAIFEMSSK